MVKFKSECLQKACKRVGKRPTVIDVGAYNGKVAKKIIKACPGADLYAIEACPRNFVEVEKRVKKAYWCAIGDTTGEIEFNVTDVPHKDGSSESNSIYEGALGRPNMGETKKVTVSMLTLDDFIERNNIAKVDLLKSNCEGGEYKIFEAPTFNWLDITKVVCMSFHAKIPFFNTEEYAKKRIKIYSILEEKGFKIIVGKKKKTSSKHIDTLWVKK